MESGGLRINGVIKECTFDAPLITVVTVVYNEKDAIEKTIKSVISQTYSNFEYLIIDGNSTDGTVDVIKKYNDKVDFWISSPDYGIYDAMNKAMDLALGEWIININTGDELIDLMALVDRRVFQVVRDYDAFACSVFDGDKLFIPRYNFMLHFCNTLHHQGLFYKVPQMKYDLTYKVFSDYNTNLAYYNNKCKVYLVRDVVIARHDLNGVSNSRRVNKELYSVILHQGNYVFLLLAFIRFKCLGVKKRLFNLLEKIK